jgi:hypothetical protein
MAQISARRGRRADASSQSPAWLDRMRARKPVKVVKVVAIALANRMARTIWARIRQGDNYRTPVACDDNQGPSRSRTGGPRDGEAQREVMAQGR